MRFLVSPHSARVAYNTNEFWLNQILQVVDQKMNQDWENFFLYLSGAKIAPEWFQLAALDISKRFHQMSLLNDKDLRVQVYEYQSHISKGNAIVVVAHSQGNLYRDAAFYHLDRLNDHPMRAKYASVSVATPTGSSPPGEFPDGEWHITLFSDYLIRAVPGAMHPNVRNTPSGTLDHFFVEHYLNGNASGPKILEDTACVLSRLNGVLISPSLTEYRDGCHSSQ